ncbi:MAG TPA: hypothetical protein VG326_13605 [Tepidisphaeraceae bacterium]|jgi:hypothetical protein|nr:hypothetical protein [Tepidisphaeraceae bacterium]
MMTIRQIERLWTSRSYARLSAELLVARQEASFGLDGLVAPSAVAALALIRMDELSQASHPLYSVLLRAVLGWQDSDGGWGEPAVTALCVRALFLGRGQGQAIEAGLAYLANLQKEQGVWPTVPLRRMPEDPAVSLFILYQLGENPRFQSAVRFNDALAWFSRNNAVLSRECRTLYERTLLRCRAVARRPSVPTLFAA